MVCMAKLKTLRCPTCKNIVLVGSEDFPFCSDRCRLIDLGKWASGGYVISSPIHDPDVLDELEGLRDRGRSGGSGAGSGSGDGE
jgi:endogenous inhibitor of DNA gyrase (YacG/DUF329 family)